MDVDNSEIQTISFYRCTHCRVGWRFENYDLLKYHHHNNDIGVTYRTRDKKITQTGSPGRCTVYLQRITFTCTHFDRALLLFGSSVPLIMTYRPTDRVMRQRIGRRIKKKKQNGVAWNKTNRTKRAWRFLGRFRTVSSAAEMTACRETGETADDRRSPTIANSCETKW